jgi:hypothetical protein
MRKLALAFYLWRVSMGGIEKALSLSFSRKLSFNLIANWLVNSEGIVKEEKKGWEEKNGEVRIRHREL